MNIIIYSTLDGEILRQMTLPEEEVAAQLGTFEDYIEHDPVDDATYQIELTGFTVVFRIYLIYNATTGAPIKTTIFGDEDLDTATYIGVPGAAVLDNPTLFWDEATKAWVTTDTGLRYIGVDPGFAFTGDHKAIYIERTNEYLLGEAVSQLQGESSTVHWKIYLLLETLAYQGDPSPVASNYLILNAYATWQGVSLADAFVWAKEFVFIGYGIAANGVGAGMKILDDIYAATTIAETQSAFFDGSDWVNQVTDPPVAPPSLAEWPASFLPSAGGGGGGGSTNIDGGNAGSTSTSSIDGGFA